MKKKGKIIVGILSGISVLAALAFGAYKISQVSSSLPDNSTQNPVVLTLSTPEHVSYDAGNYTLSWNDVEHADSYKIDINGRTVDVQDNEYVYVPQKEVTTFKVQALDSTGGYKASAWSDTVSYTVSMENGLSTPAINAYVTAAMGNKELVKIVSITSKNNIVSIGAVFSDGNLHNYEYQYANNVESLESVVENNNYTSTRARETYTAKNFDTAGSYLKSSEYFGTLEEYRRAGYTISAVSSQAYEISNSLIGLDGVYKVTNGTETKYLSIKLEFTLAATATESVRYTRNVENIDSSKVYEVSCTELQGDFVDALGYYAEGYNTTYTTNNAAYYDGGLSY